jgi:hypothetical protein
LNFFFFSPLLENWVKYDDEKTTSIPIEKIMDLKGGGDWPMCYILFYRKLEFVENPDLK